MGKIIVSELVTLDGVIEAPGGEDSLGERSGWSLPFFNEETAKFKLDDLLSSDALLMGRQTYEIHAASSGSGGKGKASFPRRWRKEGAETDRGKRV